MAKRSMLRDGAARGAYAKVLHMADGGAVPPSPYSLRGMANSVSSLAASATAPFRTPAGYTPALASAPAAAPAPAPAPAAAPVQLGGMNMGAMQQREAAAGLRDGGPIRGKGGPTEDNIPIMASPGEHMLPADTVQALGGHAAIDKVIDATHTPTNKGLRGNGYANGGGIPGIDVTENPRLTSSEARAFATDPGPGNSFANRAPALEAPPAAAAPPIATPPAAPGNAYRVARGVGAGLRSFGPAALAGAATSGFGDYHLDNEVAPGVDSSAGGTISALRNGDFGKAYESAQKGLVETGLDVASGLAKTGDMILPGHPLSDSLRGAVYGDLGGHAGQPAPTNLQNGPQARTDIQSASAQPAPSGANQTAQTFARLGIPVPNDTAGGGRGSVNPLPGNNDNTGKPILDPNAPMLNGQRGTLVDGAQGVSKFKTADGRTLYTNVAGSADNDKLMSDHPGMQISPSFSGQGSSALRSSGAGTMGGSPTLDASLAAARTAAADRGDFQAVSDSYGGNFAGGQFAAPQSGLRAQLAGKPLTARGAAALAQLDQNEETARHNRDTTQVSLRGQDVTARGQDMTSRTAANAARLDQMNKDRTYQFDREKHGDEVARQNFTQRESAMKDLHAEIATMLPQVPGPDGKPTADTQTAARYAVGLHAKLSQQQQQLEADIRAGKPGAAAAMKDLSEKGVGVLSQAEKYSLLKGMQLDDISKNTGTGALNPFGSTTVQSDQPISALRDNKDGVFGFGRTYSTNRPGEKIPARIIEKRDGDFFGGVPRQDFKSLLRNQ